VLGSSTRPGGLLDPALLDRGPQQTRGTAPCLLLEYSLPELAYRSWKCSATLDSLPPMACSFAEVVLAQEAPLAPVLLLHQGSPTSLAPLYLVRLVPRGAPLQRSPPSLASRPISLASSLASRLEARLSCLEPQSCLEPRLLYHKDACRARQHQALCLGRALCACPPRLLSAPALRAWYALFSSQVSAWCLGRARSRGGAGGGAGRVTACCGACWRHERTPRSRVTACCGARGNLG
jgi:hypothetical protein